jgi:tight adherence protein C
MQVVLASAAVITSVPLLVWSIAGSRNQRPRKVNPKLDAEEALTDLRQLVLQRSTRERVVRPGAEALARRARRFTPSGVVKNLERRIHLAGADAEWPIERVLAFKMILGGAGALLGLLRLVTVPSFGSLLLAALITGVGYFAPDLLMYHKATARQDLLRRELADTLDQITISVEAGLAFEPAMARAARSRKGPLADELSRTLQDVQLGVPRATALKHLVERTDVGDLRTFVHAVTQAEKYGVPIARILRVQAGELREKRRQAAEERAMKLPVKIVMPLILFILPALFVVLMGPAILRISQTGFGG